MTRIKPDNVQFCSFIDTYYNYATKTGNIVVSGSVPAVSVLTFRTLITMTSTNTRADVYLKNLNTGIKKPMDNGERITPYQYAASEVVRQYVIYVSNVAAPYVEVGITITNTTGAPIVLTTQTLEASAVMYLVPIVAT